MAMQYTVLICTAAQLNETAHGLRAAAADVERLRALATRTSMFLDLLKSDVAWQTYSPTLRMLKTLQQDIDRALAQPNGQEVSHG